MTNPLKMIQIGAGGWGWSWIQILLDSPYWDLEGLVIRNKNTKNRVLEHFGISKDRVFDSIDKAMDAVRADAALVVVPPEAHTEVTENALSHGLHCLVEKPIAPTIVEARKMVDSASAKGLKLMIAQNYRFKRAPQTVKQILQNKIIGEIGSVFVNFQKSTHFTGFRTQMEEPLIIDLSIHHFDHMRGILGLEPVRVTAHSWNPAWSWFKGNPVATIIFEMETGAVVTYTGNWVSQGWETTWDADWNVQATEGELVWSQNQVFFRSNDVMKEVFTKFSVETHKKHRADLVTMPAEDRYAVLLEFANAIRENRDPETSGKDNIITFAMVVAACRSVREKRPVSIEEVLHG
jgi:predicted dehydrogenase